LEGWIKKRITVNTVLQNIRKEENLTVVSENIREEAPEDSGYVNLDFGPTITQLLYKSFQKNTLNLQSILCWRSYQ